LRENSGEEADPMPIQKIISVPIIAPGGQVLGGNSDLMLRGLTLLWPPRILPPKDLRLLESAAEHLAGMPIMIEPISQGEIAN
jgi:hypothetical protein